MAFVQLSPTRLLSTADSTEEKLELLADQINFLRDDLTDILSDFETRLSALE